MVFAAMTATRSGLQARALSASLGEIYFSKGVVVDPVVPFLLKKAKLRLKRLEENPDPSFAPPQEAIRTHMQYGVKD